MERGEARGYFCDILINAGGVVAIPKEGVGHRSENFQFIKSKAFKVTIIGKTPIIDKVTIIGRSHFFKED